VRRLLRESSDVIIVLALTLTFTIIVTTFPEWQNILRASFGAVVMLLTPGYLLTLVLFPSNDGIDVSERTALTLALSAITIIGTGLVLNYLPAGIRAGSIAVSLTITNTAFAVLGSLHRGRLEPAKRFFLPPVVGTRRLFLGIMIITIAEVLFNIAIPQDYFTEFYLLGSSGELDNYPRYLRPGETFNMRVGITNHEGQPHTYRIRLPADDTTAEDVFIDVPQLQHEESWETPLTLQAPRDLGSEQLVFELLKDDSLATYRQLTFTINVDPERRERRPPPTTNRDITNRDVTNTIDATPTTITPATTFWSQTLERPSAVLLRFALELTPIEPTPTAPEPTPPFRPISSNPPSTTPNATPNVSSDGFFAFPVPTLPTDVSPLEENRAAY
jgi:uncharacterized membrane protein